MANVALPVDPKERLRDPGYQRELAEAERDAKPRLPSVPLDALSGAWENRARIRLDAVPAEGASGPVQMHAGFALVLMDALPKQQGEVLLPDGPAIFGPAGHIAGTGAFQHGTRSHTGTLIAGGLRALGAAPGARVLVRPDDGLWIEDVEFGEAVLPGEARFYGAASIGGRAVRVPLDRSIPAMIADGWLLRPLGKRLLILRTPAPETTDGGVLLHQWARTRDCRARVLAVGHRVRTVAPGANVVYFPAALDFTVLDFLPAAGARAAIASALGIPPERVDDLAFVSEEYVMATYE